MKELEHLHLDLSGINLIEASAGTGKTWAIASLYLRLLIESGLTPEEILVVTYTEAATAELRGRIRSRIREALAVLNGSETEDHFLRDLMENRNQRGPDPDTARDRLEQALSAFDTASIHTIHGFCLRALQDNAVESGSLFDTSLVTDQAELIRDMAQDFWRTRFFGDSPRMLAYLLSKNRSPEFFQSFFHQVPLGPKRTVFPCYQSSEILAIEKACQETFRVLQEIWRHQRGEIVDLLTTSKGLSRSQTAYRADLLPGLLENMETFLSGEDPTAIFSGFEKFTTETIEKNGLKKNPPPGHLFFDQCQHLKQCLETRYLGLLWEWVRFAEQRLPEIKRRNNIRFFDDLLTDLYQALSDVESGKMLAKCLRNKYRAAFIDEFQDTDPIQYDIFQTIFSVSENPLLLIGDPKQAIYGFRGADVFAYLEAAADIPPERRFTLTTNWRSGAPLLTALNAIFARLNTPFLFPEIRYHSVRPGKPVIQAHDSVSVAVDAPFQIRFLFSPESDSGLAVGKANEAIPGMVSDEIETLLKGGVPGSEPAGRVPVSPADIAVIVRTHRQASHIQESLQARGIPAVLRSDSSVFQSDTAREVHTVLRALADPGDEGAVRCALVTDLLGRSGNDIASLLENEVEWESCLERFREDHATWLQRGFMVAARALLSREGVRGRLLGRPDGERRLTDLLHCLELLHRKAHEEKLGIDRLLAWFGDRIASTDTAEEYQIRLETDENAVKIVTVHVSKGLEYPVVFCPFLWAGVRADGGVVTCHEGFRMVTDFGSADIDRRRTRAQAEILAENIRLVYVAVTRAKIRCYLFAGKISDKTGKTRHETSPLAYLFHSSDAVGSDADPVRRLARDVSDLSAETMMDHLQALVERSEKSVFVAPTSIPGYVPPVSEPLEEPFRSSETESVPVCREFRKIIPTDWQVTSFTFFSTRESRAVEVPDRDGDSLGAALVLERMPPDFSQERNVFTFPRGTAAGIFLHEVLEEQDFSAATTTGIRFLAEKGLKKHGYDREWEPVVTRWVENVLHTRLSSPDGEFRLGGLSPGSWVCEMEFFFPLRYITSQDLNACLRKWSGLRNAGSDWPGLFFRPVQGMVHGFVDMVFEQGGRYYLLDWKSNHLGFRREDYGGASLENAMKTHLYPLQYLLYTVALNRYLSRRIPGYDYQTHFGGVFYVFLRGVSPDPGEDTGFFRDRPPAEAIDELSALLLRIP
jgi:exodeoxyribonuclease V beta subunit